MNPTTESLAPSPHLDSRSESQNMGNKLEAGLGSPFGIHDPQSPGPATQSAVGNRQSKKINLPSEFTGLSPAQMDYINDHLREHTYADSQRMLFTEYGIQISINKLFRYLKKLEFAEQLEIAEDSKEAVQQLLNLYNGQPVDIDQAGLETIKRRALELAVSPKTKPTMLLNLMRIFTWEHRKSMDEHRKKMDTEKSAHRDRMAAIADRRAQCEEQRVKLLERRQTHTEKLKQPAAEFPQEMITRILTEDLRQPYPTRTPLIPPPNEIAPIPAETTSAFDSAHALNPTGPSSIKPPSF